MSHLNKPRILIATAGFGEGHNSAANHLAIALENKAEVEVIDPCALGAPFLNKQLSKLYRFVTTNMPKTWERVYRSVEKIDFSKKQFRSMRKPEQALKDFIYSYKPHAFVSTYPLYPYYIDNAFREGLPKIPVITIITDSIEINAAWRKAPSDYYLVTDSFTKESMINRGIDEKKIINTGFPVHPRLSTLDTISEDQSCSPFKVLYFPTAKKPTVRRVMRAILEDPENRTKLTIVLGKNVRKLYERAREIQLAYPNRVQIKGWTRNVPELLASHHLVVGKAGGATVHEAIAASCPMLIHHLVPGQEEGNLNLLQKIHGGYYTEHPSDINQAIQELLADDAKQWRILKQSLINYQRPSGASACASFIIDQIKNNTTS